MDYEGMMTYFATQLSFTEDEVNFMHLFEIYW